MKCYECKYYDKGRCMAQKDAPVVSDMNVVKCIHFKTKGMSVESAIYILKNYDCVCYHGKSPTNCNDKHCEFGQAVRALTVDVDLDEFTEAIMKERLKDMRGDV